MIERKHNDKSARRSRRGAAAVEFAMISMVLFQIILGMFEFCRFMYLRQVMQNAARYGCRVAVVNTGSSPLGVAGVQTQVMNKLAGQQGQLNNHATTTAAFTVTTNTAASDIRVFRADNATGQVPTALARDASGNVILDASGHPTSSTQTLATWWQAPFTDAEFGDRITVQIVCTYRPIVGQLIKWSPTVPVQITATMTSEGN